MSPTYVYGVVAADADLPDGLRGLGPSGKVSLLPAGRIAAVVGDVPMDRPLGTREDRRDWQDIRKRYATNSTTIGGKAAQSGAAIAIPAKAMPQQAQSRAKARIEKEKAQNQEQLVRNEILSDVDKGLVAFQFQKRRVDLYRTGVITKVNSIQDLTEYSLKAGESSVLDLLDAIRTRRERNSPT